MATSSLFWKNYNHQKMKTPFPLVCNAIGEKYFNRSIKLHFEGLLTCLKLLTDHRYTSYNLRIRIILIIRNIVIIGMKVRNVLSTHIIYSSGVYSILYAPIMKYKYIVRIDWIKNISTSSFLNNFFHHNLHT